MRAWVIAFGFMAGIACRPAPPATPAMETGRIAARLRAEADYAYIAAYGPAKGLAREYFYALAAMNYVQGHVRPYAYSVLPAEKRAFESTNDVIAAGAGLCGSQVRVFTELMRALGIKERTVQLFRIDDEGGNHIMAEVWYADEWHLFDVTWGTVYPRPGGRIDQVLSYEQVRRHPAGRRLAKSAVNDLVFEAYVSAGRDPLAYLAAQRPEVLYSGTGTVHLAPQAVSGGTVYPLDNLPDVLGRFPYDQVRLAQADFTLQAPVAGRRLVLRFRGNACERGMVMLGGALTSSVPVTYGTTSVVFELGSASPQPLRLVMQSPYEYCYVVLDEIRVSE